MLKRHPYVACDFPDDAVIWKYFSFTAFLAMIEDGMLYFTRAKYLTDPKEFPIYKSDADAFPYPNKGYRMDVKGFKNNAFINCWRLSDYESFGMWNAYADAATGIAIKSDVKSLLEAFNVPEYNNPDTTIGKVEYIDSKGMTQKPGERLNFYYIAFSKTKPYETEKELRLIYNDYKKVFTSKAIGFQANMKTLIKKVYVGPNAKSYIKDLVEKILKKNNINAKVIKSIVK
jgi:hypothetical protein